MKTENFIKIFKAIKEYPYYGEFKLGDLIDLSSLGEDKKDLLKDFYIFVNSARNNISVAAQEQYEFLDDFNYTYIKSPDVEYEYKEDICKIAALMKKAESNKTFILPQIIRDFGYFYDRLEVGKELEAKVNVLVSKNCIPNVEILGKAFGYTVYKKN